jgi:ubiquinone/menaquinone biosynthesis C-methylase UbiE
VVLSLICYSQTDGVHVYVCQKTSKVRVLLSFSFDFVCCSFVLFIICLSHHRPTDPLYILVSISPLAQLSTPISSMSRQVLIVRLGSQRKRVCVPSDNAVFSDALCAAFNLPAGVPKCFVVRESVSAPDSGTGDQSNQDELVVPLDTACVIADSKTEHELVISTATSTVIMSPSISGAPLPPSSTSVTVHGNTTAASSTPLAPNTVQALYDHVSSSPNELTFNAGDILSVIGKYNGDWWRGEFNNVEGYFPASYVRGLESISVQDNSDPLQDSEYFEGYSTIFIHHQMLRDVPRTMGYKEAVANLAEKFIKDKLVLDVGCGTSILTSFCSMAGAKHVYGVDASNIIPLVAQNVINENKLQDRVTLIKGKIEEVKLPVEQVNVIISEWMGSFLICESMIDSVLRARQRFLAPGGVMMPSSSTLFVAPVCIDEYYSDKMDLWHDVYDVKMNTAAEVANHHFFDKPVYDMILKSDEIIAPASNIWHIDMGTATPQDLERHSSEFEFEISRDCTMHGFGSWFDSQFAGGDCDTFVLSTSPQAPPTHWKQVVFVFPKPEQVKVGDKVTGTIVVERNQYWRRHFEATISFCINGSDARSQAKKFELWR